jgi:hypothetical protein
MAFFDQNIASTPDTVLCKGALKLLCLHFLSLSENFRLNLQLNPGAKISHPGAKLVPMSLGATFANVCMNDLLYEVDSQVV